MARAKNIESTREFIVPVHVPVHGLVNENGYVNVNVNVNESHNPPASPSRRLPEAAYNKKTPPDPCGVRGRLF